MPRSERNYGEHVAVVANAIVHALLVLRKLVRRARPEHRSYIAAAIETGAVELFLLADRPVAQPPVPETPVLDTHIRPTVPAATAGIQLLAWNRIVSIPKVGTYEPAVDPSDFATLVHAGLDMSVIFVDMAAACYKFKRTRDGGAQEETGAPAQPFGPLWHALYRWVLAAEFSDDPLLAMQADSRLLDVLEQTETYFLALASGQTVHWTRTNTSFDFMVKFTQFVEGNRA